MFSNPLHRYEIYCNDSQFFNDMVASTEHDLSLSVLHVFRWFKFTLKPPNSITRDKLQLAIWDTSFWNFFGQIWTQWTLRHILGPVLVNFDICQFLTIPGPFEYFQKMGALRKIKVLSMKEQSLRGFSI